MNNILYLRQEAERVGMEALGDPSAIVPIRVGAEGLARIASRRLAELGAIANLVEYPAVPQGRRPLPRASHGGSQDRGDRCARQGDAEAMRAADWNSGRCVKRTGRRSPPSEPGQRRTAQAASPRPSFSTGNAVAQSGRRVAPRHVQLAEMLRRAHEINRKRRRLFSILPSRRSRSTGLVSKSQQPAARLFFRSDSNALAQ